MHEVASSLVDAGISVVPIRTDGSKAPAVREWTQLQHRLPTEHELGRLFNGTPVGVAVIGGKVSGGLEILDFDKPGIFESWYELLDDALRALVDSLPRVTTPSGGAHVYYRCSEIAGSAKLARPRTPFRNALGELKHVLIETKGEGGYAITAPSPGSCHGIGFPYVHAAGAALADVRTITPAQRQGLHEAARALDELAVHQATDKARERHSSPEERPGDRFNAEASWREILEPHGWVCVREREHQSYWRRPGKRGGVSATTGGDGQRWLYVFSTSAPPLEADRAYDKFGAWVELEHGGDHRKAAKELTARGFGEPSHPPTPPPAAPASGATDGNSGDDPDDWTSRLIRSKGKGRPLVRCVANAITILANDEHWHDVLAWDDFRQEVTATSFPPWDEDDCPSTGEVTWTDADVIRLQAWLARHYRLTGGREMSYDAATVVAAHRSYHPVRDYLGGLHWDGTSRLDSWLSVYLGVKPTAYAELVGRLFLISAVARVMKPGCKVDTMLVLEGAQEIGKSTALRVLFGDEWFSDTPLEMESKDRFVALRGRWCLELAELDSLRKADVNRIKSFLSSSSDSYRPPYGRTLVTVPRQCVFAGTTNMDAYLRDETGNRRFWPVRCGYIDLQALARDRDQLWAEAAYCYRHGARWWPDRDQAHLLAQQQSERLQVDAWQPIVDAWLARQMASTPVTLGAVLDEAIHLETGRWGQPEQNRAARCMRVAGWIRRQRRVDGRRTWVYLHPSTVEDDDDGES